MSAGSTIAIIVVIVLIAVGIAVALYYFITWLYRPGCSNHDDCPEDRVCHGGQCVEQPCDNLLQCPSGYYCDGSFCKRMRPCRLNEDCPSGTKCRQGRCHPTYDSCDPDTETCASPNTICILTPDQGDWCVRNPTLILTTYYPNIFVTADTTARNLVGEQTDPSNPRASWTLTPSLVKDKGVWMWRNDYAGERNDQPYRYLAYADNQSSWNLQLVSVREPETIIYDPRFAFEPVPVVDPRSGQFQDEFAWINVYANVMGIRKDTITAGGTFTLEAQDYNRNPRQRFSFIYCFPGVCS